MNFRNRGRELRKRQGEGAMLTIYWSPAGIGLDKEGEIFYANNQGDWVGGLKGPEKQYVPDMPVVLYHTSLLQPTTAETIYFTAPTKTGEYPFVCTYPGHYLVMQGIMKVIK